MSANNRRVALEMLERASVQFEVYAPWAVTAAFYSAVHAVEGIFYIDGKLHSKDHYARNDLLHNRQYSKIWTHYRPLYSVSMVARYLTDFTDGDVSSYFLKHFQSAEFIRSHFIDHHLRQIEQIFESRRTKSGD
jgi:hypothetical protein